MTDHERLREQYEDALFALLMEGVAESEGEEALRLNEELKKDPNAEVPKDVQKRCEKTIRSAFAQKQLRATGRTAARWLTKVAVVAVLGGLMFTAAFALSEDVRVATLNALIQVMDDRTQITFNDQLGQENQSATNVNPDPQYSNSIELEWLPEGFQLESSESNDMRERITYANSVGALIEVTVTPYESGLTYNFDTEDSAQSTVTVQGHPATLYTASEDMIRLRYTNQNMPDIWSDQTLLWIDEEIQIIIKIFANNLTENELLRLADGFYLSK